MASSTLSDTPDGATGSASAVALALRVLALVVLVLMLVAIVYAGWIASSNWGAIKV